MNAAKDDKKAADEAAHTSQIKRMAARLAKDRAPMQTNPTTEQASAGTLPTDRVAREIILACRRLRARGK